MLETHFSQTQKPKQLSSSEIVAALGCHSFLNTLGDHYRLNFFIDLKKLEQELAIFEGHWQQYNPAKSNIPRFGLSLTSLDGKFGSLGLQSLREYNAKTDVSYSEIDFKIFTSVYGGCPSIRYLIDYFSPLGRSHFLKFESGGHVPPHRDLDPLCFRIVVPCFHTSKDDFVFLLGEKRLWLQSGWAYFINTRIEHSVFTFTKGVTLLILNVPCTSENCFRIKESLAVT